MYDVKKVLFLQTKFVIEKGSKFCKIRNDKFVEFITYSILTFFYKTPNNIRERKNMLSNIQSLLFTQLYR